VPKALVPLGDGPDATPLVTHALRGVLSCPDLSDVIVVAPADRMPELTTAVELAATDGPGRTSGASGTPVGRVPGPFRGSAGQQVGVRVVAGGADRGASVAAGLAALPAAVDAVLVHDAARALTPPAVFHRVVAAVRHGHPAVIPGLPVSDTIKRIDGTEVPILTPWKREEAVEADAQTEPKPSEGRPIDKTGVTVQEAAATSPGRPVSKREPAGMPADAKDTE